MWETTGNHVVLKFSQCVCSGEACPPEPGGPRAQRGMAAGSSANVGSAVGLTCISGSPRVAGERVDAAMIAAAIMRGFLMGCCTFLIRRAYGVNWKLPAAPSG